MATLIYHITHIDNLDNILMHGGLKCCADIQSQHVSYTNIAHKNIQDRRSRCSVPIYPNGVVHDYVPFYFAPRSPMLYTISRGNVEGYSDGQASVVYLVSTAEKIDQAGYPYVFTDGHAIMQFSEYYNDLKDLDQIDWNVMQSKFWNDTASDSDRKRRRQAEFLVHNLFPVNEIIGIATYNDVIQRMASAKLHAVGSSISVHVKPQWYY